MPEVGESEQERRGRYQHMIDLEVEATNSGRSGDCDEKVRAGCW